MLHQSAAEAVYVTDLFTYKGYSVAEYSNIRHLLGAIADSTVRAKPSIETKREINSTGGFAELLNSSSDCSWPYL